MNDRPRIRTAFLLLAILLLDLRFHRSASSAEPPRLVILSAAELIEAKKRLDAGDADLQPAFNKLRRDADRALGGEILSVTHKTLAPPSGDKQDYMSIAPYWWPNPSSTNGLPYVRRDGAVNPERDQVSDRKRLNDLHQSVKTLAMAYFFTGQENYAAHGVKLLRAWFIENPTRMNPHLRYAQAVPGRNLGRGAGIIETHDLAELIDAIGLIAGSKSWTQSDHKSLRQWFGVYAKWLIDSVEGEAEAKARNNHGTWYDVQVAAFALFAGANETARKIITEFPAKRIAEQIAPDGRQPHELERTQAWHYSIFNLAAFFDAAAIADKLSVDLWNYQSPDKRAVRKALDWLVPFATGEKKWTYEQITGMQPEKLAPLLRRAVLRYREPAYERAIGKLPGMTGDERWRLLNPPTPAAK